MKHILILILVLFSVSLFSQPGAIKRLRPKPEEANFVIVADTNDHGLLLYTGKAISEVLGESGLQRSGVFYVAENGNNSTAEEGNPALPYRDPWAAKDDASAGDLIYLFPGTYTLGDVSSGSDKESDGSDQVDASLSKDSVVYYLEAGALIKSQITTANVPLFFDTSGLYVKVLGFGSIETTQDDAGTAILNNDDAQLELTLNEWAGNTGNTGWGIEFAMKQFKRVCINVNKIHATQTRFFSTGETGTSITNATFIANIEEITTTECDGTITFNRNGEVDSSSFTFNISSWHEPNFNYGNAIGTSGTNSTVTLNIKDLRVWKNVAGASTNFIYVFGVNSENCQGNTIVINIDNGYMTSTVGGKIVTLGRLGEVTTQGGNTFSMNGNFTLNNCALFRQEQYDYNTDDMYTFNCNVYQTGTLQYLFDVYQRNNSPVYIRGVYSIAGDKNMMYITDTNTNKHITFQGATLYKPTGGSAKLIDSAVAQNIYQNSTGVTGETSLGANVTVVAVPDLQ